MASRSNWFFGALALLAGLLVGFAGSTLAYRFHLLRVPQEGMVERMERALKLTPAQREQVMGVMEDTRSKIVQMHQELRRQRHQLLSQASDRIRAILTPEQQKEFDRSFKIGRGDDGHGGHGDHPGP